MKGKLCHECVICNKEPICASCKYCDNHCVCAPEKPESNKKQQSEPLEQTLEKKKPITSFKLANGSNKKASLAKIVGPHPNYKLDRQFCDPYKITRHCKFYQIDDGGIYECIEYSAHDDKFQSYFKVEGTLITKLKQAEVIAKFNAPEKGIKPVRRRFRSGCSCTDGCCDNGCRCDHTCNCRGGYIYDC